jgi:cytochrome P450
MRRNLGPELYIDGKVIPRDAYVVYPFSDVHLDPDLYPNPWMFDPGRPAPDSKSAYSYVGWGGGMKRLRLIFHSSRALTVLSVTR